MLCFLGVWRPDPTRPVPAGTGRVGSTRTPLTVRWGRAIPSETGYVLLDVYLTAAIYSRSAALTEVCALLSVILDRHATKRALLQLYEKRQHKRV